MSARRLRHTFLFNRQSHGEGTTPGEEGMGSITSPGADSLLVGSVSVLSPKYTKPALQAEKNWAYRRYKRNIAMTDCLQAGYNITRQSVIAVFFLYLWWARFFFRLQSGFSISWALTWPAEINPRLRTLSPCGSTHNCQSLVLGLGTLPVRQIA